MSVDRSIDPLGLHRSERIGENFVAGAARSHSLYQQILQLICIRKRALANANQLQDLLIERMRPGRSGNEVLADALAAMKAEGINGSIYTHPIGDHGHGAGPLIGLW